MENMAAGQRIVWFFLLIVTLLDLLIPYVLGLFNPGYSHKKMVMSTLGNRGSTGHGIYCAWLVLLGIVLLYCAAFIYQYVQVYSMGLSICMTVILSAFAIGAGVLSGLFAIGETKEMISLSAKIHGYGASIGFVTVLFMPLLMAILCWNYLGDGVGFCINLLFFVLAVVTFVLFVMSDKTEFQNTMIDNEGLWQRLTLLFMYLSLDYLAVVRLSGR